MSGRALLAGLLSALLAWVHHAAGDRELAIMFAAIALLISGLAPERRP